MTVMGVRNDGRGRFLVQVWVRVVWVSAGGVLGVNARYWLAEFIERRFDPRFPWATFAINVSGSFAIGVATTLLARWLPHPQARLFAVVGFLGGYTTFSTYALEAFALWERGAAGRALLYLAGSAGAGVLAVSLGVALGLALAPSPASTGADPSPFIQESAET